MKVLIVDDEPLELLNLRSILEVFDPSIQFYFAKNGMDAYQIFKHDPIDIVCLDIRMPGWNGIDTLIRMKKKKPDPKIILVSAYGEFDYAKQAMEFGVSGYILKPVVPTELTKVYTKLRKEINEQRSISSLFVQTVAEKWLKGDTQHSTSFEDLVWDISIQPNVVIVIKFDEKGIQQIEKEVWDREFGKKFNKVIAVPQPVNGYWAYFMETKGENDIQFLNETLFHYKMEWEVKFPHLHWNYGVGERVKSLNELKKSFHSAINATLDRDEVVIQRCLNYISKNYASALALNDLAQEVHLSSSHLSRIFKKKLGETFIEVLTKYRIERAIELLINTELSIQYISDSVGFSSPDYFSHIFRKIQGLSPSQYRTEISV